MKKFLALLLAAAMLCTMAFAAGSAIDAYTDTMNVFWGNDVWAIKDLSSPDTVSGLLYPGDDGSLQLNYELFDFLNDGKAAGEAGNVSPTVSAQDFAVTVNYNKGADLVSSAGFEDGKYVIRLKQDYTRLEDGKYDLEIGRIYIKYRRSLNDHLELIKKNLKVYLNEQTLYIEGFDGFDSSVYAGLANDQKRILPLLVVDNYYTGGKNLPASAWPEWLAQYKGIARFDVGYPAAWATSGDTDVNENMAVVSGSNAFTGAAPYGDPQVYDYPEASHLDAMTSSEAACFEGQRSFIVGLWDSTVRKAAFRYYGYDAGFEVGVEFTLANKEHVWMETNAKSNKKIDALADRYDTDVEYINFVGEPSFRYTCRVNLFADDDQHIYGYTADGGIYDAGFVWNDKLGYWTLDAKELGCYIVTDKALGSAPAASSASSAPASAAASADKGGNPDTGANDIVGIAAALAAVSVLSAAAVSLKK